MKTSRKLVEVVYDPFIHLVFDSILQSTVVTYHLLHFLLFALKKVQWYRKVTMSQVCSDAILLPPGKFSEFCQFPV